MRGKQAPSDQLSLGLPALPTARTARAELVDATRRQPERKLKTFAEWPRPGTRVAVLLFIDEVLPSHELVETSVVGELLGHQFEAMYQNMVGRVRLDADQPGLSESLKASLPKVIETTLGRLRKEE